MDAKRPSKHVPHSAHQRPQNDETHCKDPSQYLHDSRVSVSWSFCPVRHIGWYSSTPLNPQHCEYSPAAVNIHPSPAGSFDTISNLNVNSWHRQALNKCAIPVRIRFDTQRHTVILPTPEAVASLPYPNSVPVSLVRRPRRRFSVNTTPHPVCVRSDVSPTPSFDIQQLLIRGCLPDSDPPHPRTPPPGTLCLNV